MEITPERLTFFAGSFVIPVIFVAANFVIRRTKDWYYTAGTDFLLIELTFSFASAVLWKDMALYIHSAILRELCTTIFIVLGAFITLCWLWAVSSVEQEVNEANRKKLKPTSVPQLKLFLSWTCAVGFFAAEILIFVYR